MSHCKLLLRRIALSAIFCLSLITEASGQSDTISAAQDMLIELTDDADISEVQYQRYLEQVVNPFADIYLLVQSSACLNVQDGYRNPTADRQQNSKSYLGDPLHHTIRFGYARQDSMQGFWKTGLVMDKDAGERWQHSLPFTDSFSLFAEYRRKSGWFRQAIVGHYRLKLGSGLLCNQHFSLGKNVASSLFLQNTHAITPHTSASEDDYMLGAAMRIHLPHNFEVIPFASARPIDGTLSSDTLRSWSTGGYHRTQSEISRRHTAWFTNCGTIIRWEGEWYRVSGNILYSQFQHTFWRDVRRDNRNAFRGHELLQGSADYEARIFGLHIKGETALDDHGGWATVNTLHKSFDSDWTSTIIFRKYSDSYRQLLASSISESSAMQGETGITMQASGPLSRTISMAASLDWFRFSTPHYGIAAPCDGYEVASSLTYQAPIHTHPLLQQLTLSYRLKSKYKSNTLTKDPLDITPYFRQTVNAIALWELSATGITLKSQIRTRLYSAQNTGGLQSGWLVSQSIQCPVPSWHLRTDLQASFFRTDDYDSRLYLSEHNLSYSFNMPMLYGQGQRYTLGIRYRIAHRITAEAKYALTVYQHQNSIGSDLQRIRGNMKNDLWMQLRLEL